MGGEGTRRGRLRTTWLGVLLVLLAPWCLPLDAHLTFLAQTGIAILCCAGFALLLGQGGLLSFGHALYFGAGAYAVAWLWPGLQAQGWAHVWVLMGLPLLAGLFAALLGGLLGIFLGRHSGAAFAMLTLALGELAWAAAQAGAGLFGGEAGVSLNRTALPSGVGWTFASSFQITVLVSAYTALGLLTQAWLRGTPFGLGLNAVRDHAARAQSLGLSSHRLRALVLAASAGFCGLAGGLFALNFEHVSSEVFSAQRSGLIMLFAILGGVRHGWGTVLGGVLMVAFMGWLSHLTPAWMIYVGLLFTGVVLWAPQGLVGSLARQRQLWRQWTWLEYGRRLLAWLAASALALGGAVVWIEMAYRWQERALLGDALRVLGMVLNLQTPAHWVLPGLSLALGGWALLRLQKHRAGP